jgi:hypothetical protein
MTRFWKTKTTPILRPCVSGGREGKKKKLDAQAALPGIESSEVVGHEREAKAWTTGVYRRSLGRLPAGHILILGRDDGLKQPAPPLSLRFLEVLFTGLEKALEGHYG